MNLKHLYIFLGVIVIELAVLIYAISTMTVNSNVTIGS
jgi:hypothetical protein